MIKANFNTYNNYVTDSLYQWDVNQDLVISGLGLSVAPEIHFANADMDRAIVRQSRLESGVVTVRIPNSLLQAALTIKAYVGLYEGETFKVIETIEIPVIAKTKPADYTIEDSDEEIYSFKALENEIANAKKEIADRCEANLVELTATIDEATATLNARVDNIVAHNNDTEGNSELVDLRVGANGVTYANAGAAVRTQINKANETIVKDGIVQFWFTSNKIVNFDKKNKVLYIPKGSGVIYHGIYLDLTSNRPEDENSEYISIPYSFEGYAPSQLYYIWYDIAKHISIGSGSVNAQDMFVFKNYNENPLKAWAKLDGLSLFCVFSEYGSETFYSTFKYQVNGVPENYYIGSNITLNNDTLNDLLNDGKNVALGSGTYLIPEPLALPSGVSITGVKGETIFKLSGNNTHIIELNENTHNISLSGITFEGNTEVSRIGMTVEMAKQKTGIANEVGIYGYGHSKNIRIENCEFINFDNAGIKIAQTAPPYGENYKITDCVFTHCYIGLHLDIRGEYNSVVGCSFSDNKVGMYVEGGNNFVSNCHCEYNGVGCVISGTSAQNDSHGSIGTTSFNHNANGILVVDINNGFTFNGCHVFQGDIHILNSKGFVFNGGEISAGIVTDNLKVGANIISNTIFIADYNGGQITGNTQYLHLKNNYFIDGADNTAIVN